MTDALPQNWVECSLDELLISLESGSRPKGGVRGIAKGIPSIGGEHLNYTGRFNFSNIKYVPEAYAERMSKGQIQPNDILIVKDGATTGKTAFVDNTFPYKQAFVNEHVFICRPSKKINPKFLFWYLWSKDGQDRILENFKGSAQGGINQTFTPNTTVPLVPLVEQERIVAKLDALMTKLDVTRARLDKIPQILNRFRQSVLVAAVSGQLTEDWRNENNISIDSWKPVKLHDVADLRLGKMLDQAKNIGEPSRYLRNINVRWFSFELGSLLFIRISKEERESLSLKNGDLLVCEGGEPGRCAVWLKDDSDIVFQKALHRIRPKKDVLSHWLSFKIKTDADSGQLQNYFTGTTIKHLTGKAFRKYEFLLPPISEQHEIVRRVEKLFAIADEIESRYQKAKAFIDKLPQSILAKAFRGELAPQDPNDEPASVLLEQIRKEKGNLQIALSVKKRKVDKKTRVHS